MQNQGQKATLLDYHRSLKAAAEEEEEPYAAISSQPGSPSQSRRKRCAASEAAAREAQDKIEQLQLALRQANQEVEHAGRTCAELSQRGATLESQLAEAQAASLALSQKLVEMEAKVVAASTAAAKHAIVPAAAPAMSFPGGDGELYKREAEGLRSENEALMRQIASIRGSQVRFARNLIPEEHYLTPCYAVIAI